jgi:hypothetical protein
MAKQVMALCFTPAVADRDGHASGSAHMLIPDAGYWFASGQQISFPSSQIAQNPSHKLAGTVMPDVFMKDCCSCVNG